MRISRGCVIGLGIAFVISGGMFIFYGFFILADFLYVGIAFVVVGGILSCCANCSSLNMPLVPVYQ